MRQLLDLAAKKYNKKKKKLVITINFFLPKRSVSIPPINCIKVKDRANKVYKKILLVNCLPLIHEGRLVK